MDLKIVLVIIFTLTSFIAFLHFIKTDNNESNFFLGLFISFFAISIIHTLSINIFYQTKYNALILIPLNLIFFPLYFLLCYFNRFFSFQVFNKSFEKLIIMVAFIELSTYLMPLGALIYIKSFDTQMISFIFWIKRIFVFILLPFSISFLIFLNQGVKKYLPNSNDDRLRIKWIREFTILLSILVFIIILPEIAYFFNYRSFILFFLQAVIGSTIVILLGLRNLNIQVSSSIETAREINIFNPETNRKYLLIKQLFEEEKIYTNTELRVSDIAQVLSLSPNYVSKIINENAQCGFNDFTNQFRVDHVIKKLRNKEQSNKTIFALAQEAGFKSKSTFQTVFKKATGKTPTQFIDEIE